MVHPRVQAFAIALRNARESKGMSQREATRQLGWSQGRLSLFEGAKRAKIPSRAEVAELDDLYSANGSLLRIAGYLPGALPDDLETALRSIVEHHVNEMLKDVRKVFDPPSD